VVSFAEELASQGIQVILDKWDLQPGHDANAFMEGIVTDPTVTKVVLVCDRKYVEKSNARSGGAGTEAQIITPELYAKKAQDKFVAVLRERDEAGKAYLPAYYGSRIYIDLTNPSTYATEFDRLLRWAWDQPLHVRPQKGEKPAFLNDSTTSAKIATGVTFRRAFDGIRNNSSNAVAMTAEYFGTLASGLEALRLKVDSGNRAKLDESVVASIEEFLPYRNEAIDIFGSIAQYACTADMLDAMHRFFEQLLPYTDCPPNVHSWTDEEFDNFRFVVHELFLYAAGTFLRFERFDAFSHLTDNEYFWQARTDPKNSMHSFLKFREHLRSLAFRNERLKLGRLSLHADLLKKRNEATGLDFKYIMAADFVLYLRGQKFDFWHSWWPETLIYAGRYGGAFEIFARAKSARYFNRIKAMLGVSSIEEFRQMIERITSNPDRIPRWQYERIDIERLVGLEAIGTVP